MARFVGTSKAPKPKGRGRVRRLGLAERIARSKRADGFTLIELLVVIVILGVVSGVVVFAVQGTGDKGKSSSVAIDERTIRTAQEAYCAKNGAYADGATLVQEKFLSDLPQYHQVNAQSTGGTCNGWKFSILRTAQADPYPAGRWDPIAGPPDLGRTLFLVRLPDGRVLAGGYNVAVNGPAAQIWDPTTGGWSTVDTPPYGIGESSNNAILLSDDPATPQSECKGIVDNCGKVLVFGLYRFDPSKAVGSGQWDTVSGIAPTCNICNNGGRDATYFQLKGDASQCGSNCGKVVIFSRRGAPCAPACGVFEVYSPTDNSLTSWPYPADADATQILAGSSYATQLPDGRVLVCCGNNVSPDARFFDPTSLTFTADPTPTPSGWYGRRPPMPQPPPILPTGDIFFGYEFAGAGGPRSSGVYTPQGGPGTFRRVPSCVPDGITSPIECLILGSLSDGRVLAIRSSATTTASSDHEVWVYNPATETWTQNPTGLNNRFSLGTDTLLLDPAGGPCGAHCGKMLTVGRRFLAEVYTP